MVKWTAEPTVAVSRIGVTASGDGGPAAAGGDVASAGRRTREAGAVPRTGSWPRQWSRSARARVRAAVLRMTSTARTRAEAGMSTAEYAVGTIAACGFAALLYKILTSGEVRAMLSALVQKALKLAG